VKSVVNLPAIAVPFFTLVESKNMLKTPFAVSIVPFTDTDWPTIPLVGVTVMAVTAACTDGKKEERPIDKVKKIKKTAMKFLGLIGKCKRVPSTCFMLWFEHLLVKLHFKLLSFSMMET
jgi:hypothetical protein